MFIITDTPVHILITAISFVGGEYILQSSLKKKGCDLLRKHRREENVIEISKTPNCSLFFLAFNLILLNAGRAKHGAKRAQMIEKEVYCDSLSKNTIINVLIEREYLAVNINSVFQRNFRN